jgi:hypothetical protein
MKKRVLLAVGLLVGLVVPTFALAAGSAEPNPYDLRADSLNVVARDNECVQFAHLNYVRGDEGHATPKEAIAAIGSADIGAGLSKAVEALPELRVASSGEGFTLLEEVEDGKRVAAYQVLDLGGKGEDWVVSAYEHSGPCTIH